MRLSLFGRVQYLSRFYVEFLVFSGRAYVAPGNVVGCGLHTHGVVRKQSSQIRRRQQIPRSGDGTSKQWSGQKEWPLAILLAAERSGVLPMTSQKAVKVLGDFENWGSRPVQQFCTGINYHAKYQSDATKSV